jgi:transcriptional regulator with XRE-family HTH domain
MNYNTSKIKEISEIVGSKVRQMRVTKQISQEELAFRANIHRAYIGQIERAELNVTVKTLAKIADGLGVEITAFF